jgi:hypothetical protein
VQGVVGQPAGDGTNISSTIGAATFWNPNEWTGHLKHLTFLAECVDFHTRTAVRFWVPVSLSQFEVKGKNSVLQFPRRHTIRVCLNCGTHPRRAGSWVCVATNAASAEQLHTARRKVALGTLALLV